jgi:uncharacterized membrane protein
MVAGAALSFAYFEGVYVLVALISVTRRMQAVELGKRKDAEEQSVIDVVEEEAPEAGWAPAWEQYGSARM